ncbi:unnamed protein product, partial [Rotaria sp. Silwood1]
VVKYSLTLPMAYLANMLYQSALIRHPLTTCLFTITRYLIVIADFLIANTMDPLLEYHNQNYCTV